MKARIKSIYRFLSSNFQTLHLEYRVSPRPRYGHGLPPHGLLDEIIGKNTGAYRSLLESFKKFEDKLTGIKKLKDEPDQDQPAWNNKYLPGLDIYTLYGMIASVKPATYIEVGSGNSTKVARKAIREQVLSTRVVSIDPFPRANIDHLADEVIRLPFENLSNHNDIINRLGENDILFIDNSHRLFPNSDVMIFFLEVLPRLKKGVIVQVHDIYLPYDYPQFMCDRFYNEQYMLAMALLTNPGKYTILLPNYYISENDNLKSVTAPFWSGPDRSEVERHGGSFWFRVN